jgi:hypothetical protein
MPVQPNAGDIVRAAVKFSHPVASIIENVWHFVLDGTGTCNFDDLLDALETILDAVYAAVDTYIHEDQSFVSCSVSLLIWAVDQWLTVGSIQEAVALPSFTPAGVNDPLPPSNAPLVRFLTDVPLREGKKYFGLTTELSSDTDARNTTALIAALLAAGQEFYLAEEEIADSDLTVHPCILSPTEDIYTTPTALVVRARPAVQRRRKEFVGE